MQPSCQSFVGGLLRFVDARRTHRYQFARWVPSTEKLRRYSSQSQPTIATEDVPKAKLFMA